MGRRHRIKRALKDFGHPSKFSSTEWAYHASGTLLESRSNEPIDKMNGVPSTRDQSRAVTLSDLWGLALEKIPLEDKNEMSHVLSGSKLDILRHVRTAVVKKRSDCEDRRWKFELNGRQIILRDLAEKIIVWIDKFKQIGDVAVNFDPIHASLPWAGIRFLLEVNSSSHWKGVRGSRLTEADNRGRKPINGCATHWS